MSFPSVHRNSDNRAAMSDCLVQLHTGLPNSASAMPSYGFAAEIEALNIVNPSPEDDAPPAVPEARQSPTPLGASPPTANFSDLGTALSSMFATSPRPAPQHNGCATDVQFAAPSPRRGSYDACSEQLHSLSLRVLDETALLHPAYSPLSSSIASSSSLEDIASIVGGKSPQSSLTGHDMAAAEPVSPAASSTARRKSSASSDSEEETATVDESKTNKVIKLPQRKGGMQLWQFLYALLSDPQYKELIEWTSNIKEREFRLHEPEAIAVWWGDHKNKRNMSYDKLSRSLRYYYDKGIIRKINGQRYVYRFCVAPEVMYRHIGNSDCRPKLKPMSIAAQNAMSKYNNTYQGTIYPSHSILHQPIMPGTVFNSHFAPPHYLAHSYSYPPPASGMNMTPPFNQAAFCSSSPERNFQMVSCPMSYPADRKVNCYQPHLLSPTKHCSPHNQPYPTQDTFTCVGLQDCLSMDGAQFQGMGDRTPSPQPLSPITSLSQHSPQSYSPLPPPPPYSCAYNTNHWDSFPISSISN